MGKVSSVVCFVEPEFRDSALRPKQFGPILSLFAVV